MNAFQLYPRSTVWAYITLASGSTSFQFYPRSTYSLNGNIKTVSIDFQFYPRSTAGGARPCKMLTIIFQFYPRSTTLPFLVSKKLSETFNSIQDQLVSEDAKTEALKKLSILSKINNQTRGRSFRTE